MIEIIADHVPRNPSEQTTGTIIIGCAQILQNSVGSSVKPLLSPSLLYNDAG